jgi:two-component system, NtrC family, sensor kinase
LTSLLLAFDIVAISVSLYQSHANLKNYDQAIEYTNGKIKILTLVGEISQSAQEINAPGNDIFDSRDPAKERSRFAIARLEYNNKVAALQSLAASPAEVKYLEDINLSMTRMSEAENEIFEAFTKRDGQAKAGKLMAEMDRRYANLQRSIEIFRSFQADQISGTLSDHRKGLGASKKLEIYFSILILMAVFGITIFGRHLGRFVKGALKDARRIQEILRSVSESAIVAFTDSKGIITEVNDNFCKISGYSRDELIGKDHRILNSGAHSKHFFKELWQTISNGGVWTGDIQNVTKNGETYFVRSVISPLKGEDGEVEQYVAIRFDITEQKRAEHELLEAQKTAKIGSWKYTFSTGHQEWSSEHYRIFEISEPQSQEKLHSLYRERTHPEDRAEMDRVVANAFKSGEDFVYNHRVYLDDGARIKYVRGIGKVTKNTKGEPIHISGTCQDLTDLVSLQEQVEAERIKVMHTAKLASLGEMAAGIAHEINNPLAIIAGSVHLLSKARGDDTKFNSKAETISKSVGRIEKIVKGLKKFSRTADGASHKVETIASLVSEALTLTEAKSKRHSTPIEIQIDPQLAIDCDGVEIEQVLVNLINNGIDAVKSSSERWIKINAFSEGTKAVLQVIDSGQGIPIEVENKLFQPFFTTKAVGEGTGLGLSIIKGILDSHKATVALNRSFKNTCFEVRFEKANGSQVKHVA